MADDLPVIRGWYSSDYDLVASVELSDRQALGLVAAWDLGYFEVPRGSTTTELGDVLGITNGSAAHRIRVAEYRILHRLIEQIRRQLPEREDEQASVDPSVWIYPDDQDEADQDDAGAGELECGHEDVYREEVGGEEFCMLCNAERTRDAERAVDADLVADAAGVGGRR